jgi:hypothetical protein
MMPGALNLTAPAHLLAKLEHELATLSADRGNSYAAINALRDAYHLREWIWHDRLEHDPALQRAIMGGSGDESAWNRWVNQRLPDFRVVKELCNGSKHFCPGSLIRASHQAGFDSPVSFWDNPASGWDDASYYVELAGGRLISVADLVNDVRAFWCDLFSRFPQLQ